VLVGLALLAQLAITAHGPDTATACLPLALTAASRAPGHTAPTLEPPRGAGIQLLRWHVTSRVEQDGAGRTSAITEGTADVAISPVGRITLPPFVATLGGERTSAAPIVVDVREPIDPPPVVLVMARLDDSHGGSTLDSLVVGQQVDYTVDVLLNEPARGRLRRNPTFFPPEMASVLAYDVDIPRGPPHGRRCFETLSYRRALFPLFPGRVAIPPAVLTYSLPLSSSFFSREESFELRSDSVRFVAVEPPVAGRPADFAGAVGTLRISARTESPTTRVGDAVVLTVRVNAVGNVKLLPRPSVDLTWASLTPGDERVEIDSTASRITGAKEFDWLITPKVAGTQVIPSIRYPYYDPVLRRYAVIETAPIPIAVAPGSLASADTATGPHLPIRVVLRDERRDPFTTHPLYWALFALAPLPATLRRLSRRRRIAASGSSPIRRLHALVDGASPPPARELRRLFVESLRERVPAVGRDRAPLGRVLRNAGVSDDVALEAEAMLAHLDDAAFSGAGTLGERAAREAVEIADMVDREAIRPSRAAVRAASALGLAIMVALSAAVTAHAVDESARLFNDGVRAYERGQFSLAERRFVRVTNEKPRAVDAWANLAAAAWEAADTAQAARAWHHALRLDPLDDDTRDRLAALQPLGPRTPAYVAPLAPDHVAAFVLAVWILAWLVLALPATLRPRAARPIAGGAIAVALVGLAGVFELESQLGARDLGVLVRSRALVETPSADAPSLATGGAGEAGRLGAREGGWVYLTLDPTRAGWVPASAVMPIEPVQPARLTGLAPIR
jgi:BatD DUF11 like domain